VTIQQVYSGGVDVGVPKGKIRRDMTDETTRTIGRNLGLPQAQIDRATHEYWERLNANAVIDEIIAANRRGELQGLGRLTDAALRRALASEPDLMKPFRENFAAVYKERLSTRVLNGHTRPDIVAAAGGSQTRFEVKTPDRTVADFFRGMLDGTDADRHSHFLNQLSQRQAIRSGTNELVVDLRNTGETVSQALAGLRSVIRDPRGGGFEALPDVYPRVRFIIGDEANYRLTDNLPVREP
jgi:hypothetical protein